jgi:hypothetical protein
VSVRNSDYCLVAVSIAVIVAVLLPADAAAHGTPIQVNVVNNVLTVSGGLADSAGFAPMIFVQSNEEGDPFGEVDLPGFGPSIIWQVPGYQVFDMAEHSGLFIDVLSRPFAYSANEQRALWYCNVESGRVETPPAANALQIRKSSTVSVTISPAPGSDPPPLQIAEPLVNDEGFHNHLVAYALNESTLPPPGAYGFFARLTSNQYAPSAPFLVVLNNGVFEYSKMVPAALAINAAAFLPGDYNHDGHVDGADYVVWRSTVGSTTALRADGSNNQLIDNADYNIWRANLGHVLSASGQSSSFTVPENSTWGVIVTVLMLPILRSRRWYLVLQ